MWLLAKLLCHGNHYYSTDFKYCFGLKISSVIFRFDHFDGRSTHRVFLWSLERWKDHFKLWWRLGVGEAPFMLVTSFRSRMPAKFSSPKVLILTGSVLCTQKSHTPGFIPWNFPRAANYQFHRSQSLYRGEISLQTRQFQQHSHSSRVILVLLYSNAEYRIWTAGCCNDKCLLWSLFPWSEHRQTTWIVCFVGNCSLRHARLHWSS